ncbi:MAG TPA: hypothetical protein VH593_06005, partial [Ktedonobacteraceae bacterium]
ALLWDGRFTNWGSNHGRGRIESYRMIDLASILGMRVKSQRSYERWLLTPGGAPCARSLPS